MGSSQSRLTRFGVGMLVLILIFSLCITTALAELSGTGNSGGIVSGLGTFTVTATGSASWGRATLRITSSQSTSSNMISIRVLKSDGNPIYSGGILYGNSSLDASLPAFLPSGTYTVEYSAASSTYLSAVFNP